MNPPEIQTKANEVNVFADSAKGKIRTGETFRMAGRERTQRSGTSRKDIFVRKNP